MEYEKLQEVNKSLKTTLVKGKPYVEVNERVKGYRQLYPNGQIQTEIVQINDNSVVIKATIFNDEWRIVATGYAQENKTKTGVNSTSWLENCETSAVGRALGFAGIGIDNSIASAEEVENAIEQQETKNRATRQQLELLKGELDENFINIACQQYSVNKLEEMTEEQADDLLKRINAKKRAKSMEEKTEEAIALVREWADGK